MLHGPLRSGGVRHRRLRRPRGAGLVARSLRVGIAQPEWPASDSSRPSLVGLAVAESLISLSVSARHPRARARAGSQRTDELSTK